MAKEKATKATTKTGTAVVVSKMERHPLSEKYGPTMSAEELTGLGLDMKAHGQHEDIIMYEGKILAGWNRYLGCVQQGLKPRFREMETGANPVAVAFGTNFIRRRLSSVQKAFYGAQFAVDSGMKQADVAKLMGCNLNRLNHCAQLLKADTDAAKAAITKIKDNPDMSGGAFDELMLEAGIAHTPAPPPPPRHTNTHSDDDDDGIGGDLPEDDLTGGAIDDLLDTDDPEDEDGKSPAPATRKPKEIGSDEPLPLVGKKGSKFTNPHETPVSRVAKAFKSLSKDDQRQFVKFAWKALRDALDTAVKKGDVEYVAPEREAGPPDPSLIARPTKKAEPMADEEVLAGKKPKTPAKKAPPAKAPAKKAPPAKAPAKKAPPAKAPAKKAAPAKKGGRK